MEENKKNPENQQEKENMEIEAMEDESTEADEGVLELPMIPLRGLTVFPNMVLHFDIGREKSINALEKAMITGQYIFLASQKDENTDLPTPEDFYHIGTIGKIKQMLKLPGDSIRVLVEGMFRGVIEDVIFEVPYFKCRVRRIDDDDSLADDAEAGGSDANCPFQFRRVYQHKSESCSGALCNGCHHRGAGKNG